MKLSFKIFTAFILTFFLSIVLMIGILKFYAARNFADYVNKTEIDSLDDIVEELTSYYLENEGWDKLKNNPKLFTEILINNLPRKNLDKRPEMFPRPDFERGQRMPPPPFAMGQNAPPENKNDWRPEDRPGEMVPLPFLLERFCLIDKNKKHIAANDYTKDEYTLREISTDDKVVGYIGLKKLTHLGHHPIERNFLNQQFKAYYIIGFGVLILSSIVSFFLSRHLLSPIKKLTDGTKDIASLKFDTRINVTTKDELGILAKDFNHMAETLEKSENMRKQWISDISHELRTPLSILQGEVEALKDGIRELTPDAICSLYTEIMYIRKIVNDLYTLSLADTDTLFYKKSKVNPVSVLSYAVDLFRNKFDAHQIKISLNLAIERAPFIMGDPDRLMQMFSNILENSLRYTNKPGSLTIHQQSEKNAFTLSFEDSGPGVPMESLSKLFNRLYRVDPSRSREKGGSGLGLSICKNIIEAHGGSICAENAERGGLIIKIRFPVNEEV